MDIKPFSSLVIIGIIIYASIDLDAFNALISYLCKFMKFIVFTHQSVYEIYLWNEQMY